MFGSHPSAALEYWFFKLNQPDVSVLVDWIARRRLDSASLRVSIHTAEGAELMEVPVPDVLSRGAIGLHSSSTANDTGEVRWQLTFTAAPARIKPGFAITTKLGTFDLAYESAPKVLFNGWIEYRGRHFDVVDAPGMLAHYWGARLARDWWWLSACAFDGPSGPMSVEFDVIQTSIWGSRLHITPGYLWIDDGTREFELVSPPARLKVMGDPKSFTVDMRPFRGPSYRLVGTGRDYVVLGDDIGNTLVGDLKIWRGDTLLGTAKGTASLEHRPYLKTSS